MDDKLIKDIFNRVSEIVPIKEESVRKANSDTPSYMPKMDDDYDPITGNFTDNMNQILEEKEKESQFIEETKHIRVPKGKIASAILDTLFQDYIYYQNGGFTRRELISSRLFDTTNVTGEDLIITTVDGVRVRYAETFKGSLDDAVETYKKDTHSLFEFDLKPVSNTNLLIVKAPLGRGRGMKKVKTSNSVFNKKFKVLTDNKKEFEQILTNELMEYILLLNENYNDKIECSIIDNKLYLKIQNNALFEYEFEVSYIEEATLKSYSKELKSIIDVVQFLIETKLV